MGSFLAVTAFRVDSIAEVTESIREYVTHYNVQVESVPVTNPPDDRRDAQIYAPINGWTVVLWPEYFSIHDFPFVRATAAKRNWLVSTIHVYDDEYWEHLSCVGPKELHVFCSRPNFWRNQSPDDHRRMLSYAKDPGQIASHLGVPTQVLQPYLLDVDALPNPHLKAHAQDSSPLGDFWVFIDFWRRLGIDYPTPRQNLAMVLQLSVDFRDKLPAP